MSKKEENKFLCRHINSDQDIQQAFDIINTEDWIMIIDKLRVLCKTKPKNFLVVVTQPNEVAGTISISELTEGHYVIGNLIVNENMRKKGLGRMLMQHAVSFYPYKTIELLSVPGSDQFYRNLGFRPCGEDIFNYHMKADAERIEQKLQELDQSADVVNIFPFEKSDLKELINYDYSVRGYNISWYISITDHWSQLVVAKVNQKITGYAVAYMKKGEIILDGLCADSDRVAALLFRDVLRLFPGENRINVTTHASNTFLCNLGDIMSPPCCYEPFYLGDGPSFGEKVIIDKSKCYCVTDVDFTK